MGTNLFHLAAKYGDVKTAELQLKKGIDINVKNSAGETPLHIAVKNEEERMVKFLIKNGAEVDAKDFFLELLFTLLLKKVLI